MLSLRLPQGSVVSSKDPGHMKFPGLWGMAGRQTLRCRVPWERSQGFESKLQQDPSAARTGKYFGTNIFIVCGGSSLVAPWVLVWSCRLGARTSCVGTHRACVQVKRSAFRARWSPPRSRPCSRSPGRQGPLPRAHERRREVAALCARCGFSPACKLSVT